MKIAQIKETLKCDFRSQSVYKIGHRRSSNLKIWVDCAVDDKVDGRVEDHEKPGDRVKPVEPQGRDVLAASLDAEDDELSVCDLVS